jgi:hypothetical protein
MMPSREYGANDPGFRAWFATVAYLTHCTGWGEGLNFGSADGRGEGEEDEDGAAPLGFGAFWSICESGAILPPDAGDDGDDGDDPPLVYLKPVYKDDVLERDVAPRADLYRRVAYDPSNAYGSYCVVVDKSVLEKEAGDWYFGAGHGRPARSVRTAPRPAEIVFRGAVKRRHFRGCRVATVRMRRPPPRKDTKAAKAARFARYLARRLDLVKCCRDEAAFCAATCAARGAERTAAAAFFRRNKERVRAMRRRLNGPARFRAYDAE